MIIDRRFCMACNTMRDHVDGRCAMAGHHGTLRPCACGCPTTGTQCAQCAIRAEVAS